MKIIPSTVSIEDLLKELQDSKPKAESEEPIKRRKKRNFILEFLSTFNIEPGEYKVDKVILHRLYNNFSEKPLNLISFTKRLKNYIPSAEGRFLKGREFFLINHKSLDISDRVLSYLEPESRPATKMIPLQLHFNNFVKKYNIKAGKKPKAIWVSVKTLYDLYDEWSYKIRKKKPLGYNQFNNFCKIYFPIQKESDGKVWLSLDDSIEQLMNTRTVYNREKEESKK